MKYKNQVIQFENNRVWRSYLGGKTLDSLGGAQSPQDTHFPEEWIASTTKAVNPGREDIQEGESIAILGNERIHFSQLIALDPDYFLGEKHVAQYGANPMVLVKFLDSSIRLHFQVHPTRDFSLKHLNSNSGKAEAYYILKVRDEVQDPYLYLGFQNPPSKDELKEIILKQDITSLKSCFKKIPVKEGECYFIPGGMPHAIGEGILMIEVMEPSDWAVRFEFERGGYTLPEEARFMKRDLDFCLDVFDYSKHSVADVIKYNQKQQRLILDYGNGSGKYSLIDETTTDRYRVCLSKINGQVTKSESEFYIGIISSGQCTLFIGDEVLHLKEFDKFFCPAGLDSITILSDEGVDIIECYPPEHNG
ncbi:class I mannose-6-phosphate isomerase [Vibrio aphrogenes]|uniref:class I mannose-6-phosphate isomerase n=1 Tax=Vibrio aphrogenes TaxID=1891186 RepID=UPI000B34D611|nr:class I mannose-6-phosphate isomerase [Vibrio aphrogenes]